MNAVRAGMVVVVVVVSSLLLVGTTARRRAPTSGRIRIERDRGRHHASCRSRRARRSVAALRTRVAMKHCACVSRAGATLTIRVRGDAARTSPAASWPTSALVIVAERGARGRSQRVDHGARPDARRRARDQPRRGRGARRPDSPALRRSARPAACSPAARSTRPHRRATAASSRPPPRACKWRTICTSPRSHRVVTFTGQWLIDPHDYTLAPSGGDMTGAQLSVALMTSKRHHRV